ncbi:MAG TPA: hypothetical protein VFN78_06735 [Ktedonobacterales bacterium]|nr:hypothetical protein [Ktedonobacterales bacterium]
MTLCRSLSIALLSLCSLTMATSSDASAAATEYDGPGRHLDTADERDERD